MLCFIFITFPTYEVNYPFEDIVIIFERIGVLIVEFEHVVQQNKVFILGNDRPISARYRIPKDINKSFEMRYESFGFIRRLY